VGLVKRGDIRLGNVNMVKYFLIKHKIDNVCDKSQKEPISRNVTVKVDLEFTKIAQCL